MAKEAREGARFRPCRYSRSMERHSDSATRYFAGRTIGEDVVARIGRRSREKI